MSASLYSRFNHSIIDGTIICHLSTLGALFVTAVTEMHAVTNIRLHLQSHSVTSHPDAGWTGICCCRTAGCTPHPDGLNQRAVPLMACSESNCYQSHTNRVQRKRLFSSKGGRNTKAPFLCVFNPSEYDICWHLLLDDKIYLPYKVEQLFEDMKNKQWQAGFCRARMCISYKTHLLSVLKNYPQNDYLLVPRFLKNKKQRYALMNWSK